MFYLLTLWVIFICVCVVKTAHSCVCTQPLNPQFLCVDEDCEAQDSLVHHYCNSNFVIKIMITSDRLFSAISGSFNTKVGYKYSLVHVYKIDKIYESALETNIIWTSQDSCGVTFKRMRLYIISGSVDKDRITARTSTCDFIKAVKDLKINDIHFFGHSHKLINCSKMEMDEAEPLANSMLENSTAKPEPDNTIQEIKEAIKLQTGKIMHRPILPDKNCYCGPGQSSGYHAASMGGPGLTPGLHAVNIGLGAANNNGENGWNNVNGGFNLAIASGNGNQGNGINSVNPNGVVCVAAPEGSGSGNGNGGVNIGIVSGNHNGGHGWNIGNGGNNVEADGGADEGDRPNGAHNVGSDSGNGFGGTNIGIMAGNSNKENGWNVGNGGNNAGDNTFNNQAYAEPNSKGSGSSSGLGHGGNNVGDNSGNGNGGKNWGFWSGNANGVHGWHTGNGGNNAGDNVGNAFVQLSENEDEFIAHSSGIGGNNRGNNTGNGKGGTLSGFGSGQNNGVSNWSSGNGGNNVGDYSGNGMVGEDQNYQRRPSGRKPWWNTGVGNGGNNIGSNSGNGFGSYSAKEMESNNNYNDVINDFIPSVENKVIENHETYKSEESDEEHIKKLMDEIETENNKTDNDTNNQDEEINNQNIKNKLYVF